MCGIAGWLSLDASPPPDDAALVEAARRLHHRGPDSAAAVRGPTWALVHTRLAVIDPTPAGHQPFVSPDGRRLLVYNGEVYDFRDLRPALEREGWRFRSRTDTEVVLAALSVWGEEALDRLEGIFALALLDRSRPGEPPRLLLARDRFGVKPLYVAETPGAIAFASEPKALLALGVEPALDRKALAEYLTFQNVFSDRTLLEGVRMLPAGTALEAGPGGVRRRRFAEVRYEPDDGLALGEAAGRLREGLRAAVRRQLVADVPLGAYLSGGLDSGSIVAAAAEAIPRISTFTGGFDVSTAEGLEVEFDERAEAETVASRYRTEHYEAVFHAGDMVHALPSLVWHLDDPRVGMCWPAFYVARLASRFVKVALAGTGGDELFAGYPWRYLPLLEIADAAARDDARFAYWRRLDPGGGLAALAPEIDRAAGGEAYLRSAFDGVLGDEAFPTPLHQILAFEARTFLHGLLVVEDRVSMAHGLEVRVPLLDDRLADLARRLPAALLLDGGREEGKRVLREAVAPMLPDRIVRAKKQGFSPPDRSWFRGPTIGTIRETVGRDGSRIRALCDAAAIDRVIDEHQAGAKNHRLLLWSLLVLEHWLRTFLERRGAPPEGVPLLGRMPPAGWACPVARA